MADHKKEIDKVTGVETTGHEWDGLKELNNPMPRWWLWTFFVSCIWAFGYWVVYPTWPTIEGHTKGLFGWTQHGKLAVEQKEITDRKQNSLDAFKGKSLEDIRSDKALFEFAIQGGSAMFKDNCATCHGTGAEGTLAYPNLNDDDWIWGGKLEEIQETIAYGVRSGHDETRDSQMPAFGKDGILNRTEIDNVADYVLSLSKKSGDFEQNEAWKAGATIYADNCASCHGDKGEGSRDFGAPKLNDAIWLRGETKKDVMNMIYNAKMGIMPNWDERLDEETIKMLTIYVHSLGGGEQ